MRWVQFPDGLGIDEPGLWRWLELTDADPHRHHFVVRANGTFCGEVFYAVDGRRAELDIKLVPEAQGRGVATHALTWLVDHAFDHEPAVDEVWTEPWPENAPARALYVRCGLVERQRPPELRPGPSFFSRRR